MSDQEGQVLWCSLVFDFLWVSCSLGFSLWCSLVISGVLWDSLGLVFSGVLWDSLEFFDSRVLVLSGSGGAGSLVFLDGNDGRARIRLVSIQWVSLGIVAIILYGATGHLL